MTSLQSVVTWSGYKQLNSDLFYYACLLLMPREKTKSQKTHSNYSKNGVHQTNANTEWWETISRYTRLTNFKSKINRLKQQKREY